MESIDHQKKVKQITRTIRLIRNGLIIFGVLLILYGLLFVEKKPIINDDLPSDTIELSKEMMKIWIL